MGSPDHTPSRRHDPWVRVGGLLHRWFLPVLLGVYVLAGVLPGPGKVIREYAIDLPGGASERASMLLLAVLLFCAAAVIEWPQVRELLQRPSVVLIGLLTSWFGPALLVAMLGPVVERLAAGETATGMLVGFALVAAMPVANSSAGWTQNTGGNVALSLGLIVLSILLSPLATPNLLQLMGWALSPEDTQRLERLVTQFSGWRFILWVIVPSLAGAAAAWALGHHRIRRARPLFRTVSLLVILVLNYANASLAVATIWSGERWSIVALAAVMAALVSVLGIALATVQALVFHLRFATWSALAFSLSMKHTGLALVLAGEFLHDQPRVVLVVLLTTLAQHVAAAGIDLAIQRVQARRMA
jgi:BASS family bile acid:Na+ symporter